MLSGLFRFTSICFILSFYTIFFGSDQPSSPEEWIVLIRDEELPIKLATLQQQNYALCNFPKSSSSFSPSACDENRSAGLVKLDTITGKV